ALQAFEAAVAEDTSGLVDPAPRIIDLTTESLLEVESAGHPEPVDIDLTLERDPETHDELARRRASLSSSIERHERRETDSHETFEALHRKARAAADEPDPPGRASEPDASDTARAPHPAAEPRLRKWFLARRRQSEPGNS